jgi:hypothetical protein
MRFCIGVEASESIMISQAMSAEVRFVQKDAYSIIMTARCDMNGYRGCSCRSVRPHVSTRDPLGGFSRNMILVKVTVKFSLCLTNLALCHEGVWESGCIDPCFRDLGTSWR